jgi:hypothetical protein
MFVLADRVKETSITPGSGNIELLGPLGGFRSFSDGIGEGNSTYYAIENGARWEVGYGTYTSNFLSRDVVLKSSNNNNLVALTGVSIVFCTYPAEKAAYFDQQEYLTLTGHSGVLYPDGSRQTTASLTPIYEVQSANESTVASGNMIFVTTGPSNITITLPDNIDAGNTRIVKKIDSGVGNVIISRQSIWTIDGANSFRLYNNGESMSFVSDGSGWRII